MCCDRTNASVVAWGKGVGRARGGRLGRALKTNGYDHCLAIGDSFMGVYVSKFIKLYTLPLICCISIKSQ